MLNHYGDLVTYDEESRSGSGSEASQRKVVGTLYQFLIQHALEAEVRLYDRLFTDEAPESLKRKNFFRIYESKFFTNCEGICRTKLEVNGTI
jgi:glutaminyl-tRNA synthetase